MIAANAAVAAGLRADTASSSDPETKTQENAEVPLSVFTVGSLRGDFQIIDGRSCDKWLCVDASCNVTRGAKAKGFKLYQENHRGCDHANAFCIRQGTPKDEDTVTGTILSWDDAEKFKERLAKCDLMEGCRPKALQKKFDAGEQSGPRPAFGELFVLSPKPTVREIVDVDVGGQTQKAYMYHRLDTKVIEDPFPLEGTVWSHPTGFSAVGPLGKTAVRCFPGGDWAVSDTFKDAQLPFFR